MRQCVECGKSNDLSAKFCKYCGTPLSANRENESKFNESEMAAREPDEKTSNRKPSYILIATIIIAIIAGVSLSQLNNTKEIEDEPEIEEISVQNEEAEKLILSIETVAGNTVGNINNEGLAAVHDNWIYLAYNGLYKMNIDTSEVVYINDDSPSCINVIDGWIYYVNNADGGHIYKTRTDGSERLQINTEQSSYMTVYGGWIYYVSDDGYHIYRIKTDGSERTQLNEYSMCYSVNVVGDWIYYRDGLSRSGIIHKMRLDGTESSYISELLVTEFIVIDDWIYYVDFIDNKTLKRMRTDGSERSLINNEESHYLNYYDGWLYFTEVSESEGVYRIRPDGRDKMKLNEDLASNNIASEWLFNHTSDLYVTRLDGSERFLFSDVLDNQNKLEDESNINISVDRDIELPPVKTITMSQEGDEYEVMLKLHESPLGYILYYEEDILSVTNDGTKDIFLNNFGFDNLFMTIEFVQGASVENIRDDLMRELYNNYDHVNFGKHYWDLPDLFEDDYISAHNNFDSEDRLVDIYFVYDESRNGTFVISQTMFMEAAPGWGSSFAAYLREFRIMN